MNDIVPEFLSRYNYANWSACMKSYLLANDLWDIMESNAEPPTPEENESEFKAWRKKNAEALHAIQTSCFSEILSQIRDISSAKLCWDTLAKTNELNVPGDQVPPQEPVLPPTEVESHPQAVSQGYPVLIFAKASLKYYFSRTRTGNKTKRLGLEDHVRVQMRPLREAIEKGDSDAVQDFVGRHPDSVSKKIAGFGETALHVATLAGNTKIVEVLVEFMSEEDMEIVDENEDTAFVLAAVIGSRRIAEIMVKKNIKLVTIPTKDILPVTVACSHGHRETTRYLYSLTSFELLRPENGYYGSSLLHETISRQMFDISLDLLERCPSLATRVNHLGINPLHEFSGLNDFFPSGSRFIFWKQWIYSRIHVQLPPALSEVRISMPQKNLKKQGKNILVQGLSHLQSLVSNFLEFLGLKQIYDRKLTHAYALKILHHMSEYISTIDDNELGINGVYAAFFNAIKRGVVEVVVEMIKANSTLLTVVDYDSRGVLLNAVAHRQENIFGLVYVLDTYKYMLISGIDRNKNNMLHIAANLAPSHRLARISGAALQMQRELQWYKEVESIVSPLSKEHLNRFDQRPGDIFSESHLKLVADGEKWMKETATSCSVVGALIITIMFTAAFTVPGGNDQESGFPLFLHMKTFIIFIISDAISLFASSTSVLTFLGVLTSRYAEEDFLKSLPTKLIIALSTLFVSIAAMMVAFCSTLIIMLRGQLNLIMPLVLLASIPVTLFVLQQFPLLVDIFASTYGPGIFDRKLKNWY
ncbi:uncharacterized protein LOC8265452 isoform X1 [Ricinus communis]|uniref:uncharacterized protein LOC8265452 isoform X1 n=1 Tax=Ricinus communis TaxID=3988 RepID=UPI00201ABEE5|nr:uncharacterized protein LOC8265452 isoform X1 [Ricinus communis]XP_048229939.1 uncharacterized protein LOC8265452 isoform X1 [Ricinus communis]